MTASFLLAFLCVLGVLWSFKYLSKCYRYFQLIMKVPLISGHYPLLGFGLQFLAADQKRDFEQESVYFEKSLKTSTSQAFTN